MLRAQQVLSVLGFGGWVGRPPLPQALNLGKRGPLLEGINKEQSWSGRPVLQGLGLGGDDKGGSYPEIEQKRQGSLGGAGRTSSRPMRRAGEGIMSDGGSGDWLPFSFSPRGSFFGRGPWSWSSKCGCQKDPCLQAGLALPHSC